MNYITIDVNKKFLVIAALLGLYVLSLYGAYKLGVQAGVNLAVEYFSTVLQGKSLSS